MRLVEYLHKRVKIEDIDGQVLIGFIWNVDPDFMTVSGERDLTIQQDGISYELVLKESEIASINHLK